jgi:hypothetical protein
MDYSKHIDARDEPQRKQDQRSALLILFIVFIIAFWMGYFLR